MPKDSSQKGAIEISTIAAIIIIAAVVATISIIATSKYYEGIKNIEPVAVITPNLTPVVTPTPLIATPTPVIDETVNWKIISDTNMGYELKFPINFYQDTVHNLPEDIVTITDAGNESLAGKCPDIPSNTTPLVINGEKLTIGAITYCKYAEILGAAGHDDADYKYTVVRNNQLYTLHFVTVYTHCGGGSYVDRAGEVKCEKLNEEIPKTIEKVVSTFKFTK